MSREYSLSYVDFIGIIGKQSYCYLFQTKAIERIRSPRAIFFAASRITVQKNYKSALITRLPPLDAYGSDYHINAYSFRYSEKLVISINN